VFAWAATNPYGARWAADMLGTQAAIKEEIALTKEALGKDLSADVPYRQSLDTDLGRLEEAQREGARKLQQFKEDVGEARKKTLEKELSPQEKQLFAMGEVGAKLTELNVGPEEKQQAFEKLAGHPAWTPQVSEILQTINPGDKAGVKTLLGQVQEAKRGLGSGGSVDYTWIDNAIRQAALQGQEQEEPKTLLDFLLEMLEAILSAPIRAAAETVKETVKQAEKNA